MAIIVKLGKGTLNMPAFKVFQDVLKPAQVFMPAVRDAIPHPSAFNNSPESLVIIPFIPHQYRRLMPHTPNGIQCRLAQFKLRPVGTIHRESQWYSFSNNFRLELAAFPFQCYPMASPPFCQFSSKFLYQAMSVLS